MDKITNKKLDKYFEITKKALEKAKEAKENLDISDARKDFIDTVERYVSDAGHFRSKGDMINAFAALNYAHGWLDAGARIGLFDVKDSNLFSVDD